MARSVLASEMLQRVRYAADCENDTHVKDAEIYLALTSAVAETWEKIQENGLGGEAIKTVFFNTVNNQQNYAIATMPNGVTSSGTGSTGIADFWKVKTMYVNDGTGLYRPVQRTNPDEEYGQKPPQTIISMKLCYVPCAPTFVTGAESFDGINGWEEHSIQLACIAIKAKKEDDTGQYRARVRELESRMERHANRVAGEPPRVIRRRGAAMWAQRIAPYLGGVIAWDLRGGNIELYAPSYGLYI